MTKFGVLVDPAHIVNHCIPHAPFVWIFKLMMFDSKQSSQVWSFCDHMCTGLIACWELKRHYRDWKMFHWIPEGLYPQYRVGGDRAHLDLNRTSLNDDNVRLCLKSRHFLFWVLLIEYQKYKYMYISKKKKLENNCFLYEFRKMILVGLFPLKFINFRLCITYL